MTRIKVEGDLLKRVMDTSPAGIVVVGPQGVVQYGNERAKTILGLEVSSDPERTYDDPSWKITDLDGGDFPEEELPFLIVSRTLEPVFGVQHAIEHPDGTRVLLSINAAPLLDDQGEFEGMVASLEDISENRATTRALLEGREELRLLFENSVSGVAIHEIVVDESGAPVNYVFLDVNPAFQRLTGLKRSEILGRNVTEVIPGIEDTSFIQIYGEVALGGEPISFEQYSEPLERHFVITAYQVSPGRFATVFGDISERMEAQKEREGLERQLRQSQKMEAVGRLAGGIAHDFNNMLQTILGFSDMLLTELDDGDPQVEPLSEIRGAALRSAELTKQLLAFARKQTISPKVLDLNSTVSGMLKMLQRLIGEDIDLLWKPRAELDHIKMDPSQVDQVLANLLVNARDAISGVGLITIETGQVDFDEEYCSTHPGFLPGRFVMLAVSDDGMGMEAEVESRIFEPFFTTKPSGEGSGLGLATVYGIVKQNQGFINVYSEAGVGTTFRIYLPPEHLGEISAAMEASREPQSGGSETILLAEDDEAILRLGQQILEQLGYTVLAANRPDAALRLAETHEGEIDLLLTDVVMPGMSGRDLYQLLLEARPGVRCIFMSGYTANVIAHRGVLDEGVHFLQKPFTAADMARKLRLVLGDDE